MSFKPLPTTINWEDLVKDDFPTSQGYIQQIERQMIDVERRAIAEHRRLYPNAVKLGGYWRDEYKDGAYLKIFTVFEL